MAFCEYCGKKLADGEVCSCTAGNKQAVSGQTADKQAVSGQTTNEQKGNSENKSSQIAEQAGQMADQVTKAVSGAASQATKAASEVAGNAAKAASGVAGQVASQAGEVAGKVKRMSGNRKWIMLLPVAVVVLVVLFVATRIVGSDGYMDPVNDFIALVNKKGTDPVAFKTVLQSDYLASSYEDYVKIAGKTDEYKDDSKEQQRRYENCYDNMDDEWDKWKLSFDMKSKEKLDKDDLEDIKEEHEEYYEDTLEHQIDYLEDILEDEDEIEDIADSLDISEKDVKSVAEIMIEGYEKQKKMNITAGYEVKGRFVFKADDEEYKTDTVKFTVVKVNGDWCYAGPLEQITFKMKDSDMGLYFIEDALNWNYLYIYF